MPESERNSATGVRTRILRFRSSCDILVWLFKSCWREKRFESWQHTTRDELGCRTTGEDCWGRKRNIFCIETRLPTFYFEKIDSTCSFLSVAEEAYHPPCPFFQVLILINTFYSMLIAVFACIPTPYGLFNLNEMKNGFGLKLLRGYLLWQKIPEKVCDRYNGQNLVNRVIKIRTI